MAKSCLGIVEPENRTPHRDHDRHQVSDSGYSFYIFFLHFQHLMTLASN
jgi:hypothetical protein